jgi:hypothetical protein
MCYFVCPPFKFLTHLNVDTIGKNVLLLEECTVLHLINSYNMEGAQVFNMGIIITFLTLEQ